MESLTRARRWRVPVFTLAAALLVGGGAGAAPGPPPQQALTLEQALELAFERSPVLRARRARVEEVRGQLVEAATYPFNPTLGAEAGQRRGLAGSVTDRGITLSHGIEIGGHRRRRVEVARSLLREAEARYLREQRRLAATVEVAFVEAVRARELRRLAEADAELTRELLRFSERRLAAGKSTRVEVNLARAAVGRASRALELAAAGHDVSRSVLAEAVGLDPAVAVEPVGELQVPREEPPPLAELVRSALRKRADLRALRQARETAQRRIALARSRVYPDLFVDAFLINEEGERVLGGSVGVSLPLFNRNQGPVAQARAALARASAEGAAAELAARREVVGALALYRSLLAAAEQLREDVIGKLEENLALLQRAFEAGKLGLTEVLVFRREFVESQRDYIEVVADAWQARVTLALASGRISLPPTPSSGAVARFTGDGTGRLGEGVASAFQAGAVEEGR